MEGAMYGRTLLIFIFTSFKIVPSCNNTIADKINLITKNHLSSIVTREVAEQEVSYDKFPITSCTKQQMLFDISPMLERPLILDTVSWANTNIRFSSLANYPLMSNLFISSPTLKQYLSNYSFFRCHACAYVTVTGTINHQGTLLAGVKPYWYFRSGTVAQEELINTLMTGPHAMLGANEATSACIEIPFYVATDFLTLDATSPPEKTNPDLNYFDTNPYAELVLLVMNPLVVAGASSTTVSVHVQIKINKLEVYAPTPGAPTYVPVSTLTSESMLGRVATSALDKTSDLLKNTSADFIDALRGVVKSYTGLHNPNRPNYQSSNHMQTRNRANQVDAPTYYEKLDPYSEFSRITKDSIFHTDIDEMDMNYILSKPQYVSSFKVTTSNTAGTLLFSRPISPWQGGMYGGQALSSNIERLYYSTSAWSGDMELIIQSNMTNKQNLKLLVAKVYGLDERILGNYISYNSIKTGITTLLEYSAGNQQLVVDLDFVSRNQILYNTIDPKANALQHGMYFVFLAQPLVIADSVPIEVEFNVFLRCKPNFRYYGYGARMGYSSSQRGLGPFIWPPSTARSNFLLDIHENEDEPMQLESESFTPNDSAKVMNEPSTDNELTHVNTTGLTPIMSVVERMCPVQHLRDLVRRIQNIGRIVLTANSSGQFSQAIPVTALFNLIPRNQRPESLNTCLAKMYAGMNMGLKVKIRCFQGSNLFVQYYPPTIVHDNGNLVTTVVAANSPFTDFNASGIVNGGNFCEMPHSWYADIGSQETGSVFDIHIPHSTIFNFWGGPFWSGPVPGSTTDGYRSILNNNGYLIVSGLTTPDTTIELDLFVGVDDETRLGFHTLAPILFIPISSSKTLYQVPEKLPFGTSSGFIGVTQPQPCYFSTLSTIYNTPL